MEEKRAPHVLIFPFPAQGHIHQMLTLAELLCLSSIQVTFLNTHHNHHRLLQFTNIQSRFARFPGLFRLESISDGAPDDHPRPSGFLPDLTAMMHLDSIISPHLRNLILSTRHDSGGFTCIICDGIMTFAIDVAKELGIQSIAFRTISASCFFAYLSYPHLQDGEDLDEKALTVPGMEKEKFFFRRRDLPGFSRQFRESPLMSDSVLEFCIKETFNSARASALILNTTEDLESPFLSQIRTKFHKVYAIGPLHSLAKNLRSPKIPQSHNSSSSPNNGLWEEDRSCLAWLESQPPKSVVYVSFGSIAVLTKSQLLEFWHGLVNSGYRFLWVRRPGSISGGDEAYSDDDWNIPAERGCVVKWAPQEEVLGHRAVGAFVTHSGWNSTLESMAAAVPMICWPKAADQPVISRVVGELWRVGVDMKDVCDRSTVEETVRYVMGGGGGEMGRSTAEIAEVVRRSVSEGGSSYCDFQALVKELKSGCR
ncbi:hypothetical protein Sjap_013405 [Stephania japonica]|uniref:Glycosyltransferase n=1 Tax=Stephania japonica TaxID=461633 RepID=A0AAP0NYK5_9MAGN